MADLKILTCPAPTLFRRARAVCRVSLRVRRLAHDMLATMYAASGVGLAAPQVGVGKRLIAQRQTHDFKIMLVRRTLHWLATGLTTQYSYERMKVGVL